MKKMTMKDSLNNQARFDIVWPSCNIPPRLINASFGNYQTICAEKEKALNKCREFAKSGLQQISNGSGIFLQGPVGTGKSHLAVATLREIIASNIEHFGRPATQFDFADEPVCRGYNCFMVSIVDLLGTLRESFNADQLRAPAQRMLRRARHDALVILDDIGAEKPSSWVEEQLYSIIDLRYRMKRSTFFTTNCSLKELETRIGSRSVSRIMEMCEGVKVGGVDWRKRN